MWYVDNSKTMKWQCPYSSPDHGKISFFRIRIISGKLKFLFFIAFLRKWPLSTLFLLVGGPRNGAKAEVFKKKQNGHLLRVDNNINMSKCSMLIP